MLRKVVALVVLAFAVAGCSDAGTAARPAPRPHAPPLAAAPVGLVVAPRWVSEECATVALLRPACPAALPLAFRWRVGVVGYEMTLHGWAPFRETAPTLRVLVGRTLAGPRAGAPGGSPESSSDGLRWTRTPAWLADACRSLRSIRAACPQSIPLGVSGAVTAEVMRIRPYCRAGGGTRTILSAEWSAEDPTHPERNRPPGFMHLEVSGGATCLRWRFRKPAVRPRAGMMRGRGFLGATAVPLGRRTWGGHRGLLVLGDCYGNHLCFRWRVAGRAYQIDLHGWEPFPETMAALRRIVSSTR